MQVSLILRGVALGWASVVVGALAGILLTPYVLHRLGDEAYGLWVLVVTFTGYYGLLDSGIRASILRYVSRARATDDHEGVHIVVATGFYYYLASCMVVILATYFMVDWVAGFFSIHAELLDAFKSLFLLAGIVQGLTLPLLVFAATLEATGRYDQVYSINIVCLALRVVGVVAVLNMGGGLFGVGAAVVLSQFLPYCIQVPLAIRANGGLSLRPKWVRTSMFKTLFGYGSVSLAIGTAEKIRDYVYPVVIAKFLTPAAVTVFSLPMKMLMIPTEAIGTMTQFVNPLSSQLEAKNDFGKLRELIQLSLQSAYLILAPVAIFLICFGRELLTLWVGEQYASIYPVLVLLTLGVVTSASQCTLQSMLFGIGRHKRLMWYRVGEGLSIGVLGSLVLHLGGGLMGFGMVMTVTLLATSLLLVPRYLCAIIDLSLRDYFREAYIKPCIVAVPLAITLIALRSWWPVKTWMDMLVVVVVGGAAYLFSLLFVMRASSLPTVRWVSIGVLDLVGQRLARKTQLQRDTAAG